MPKDPKAEERKNNEYLRLFLSFWQETNELYELKLSESKTES